MLFCYARDLKNRVHTPRVRMAPLVIDSSIASHHVPPHTTRPHSCRLCVRTAFESGSMLLGFSAIVCDVHDCRAEQLAKRAWKED